MGIDGGFIDQWRELCPEAFLDREEPLSLVDREQRQRFLANNFHAFIDGQLKLMRGGRAGSWEHFLDKMFVDPINRLFRLGAVVVILAFDDYSLVPTAKAPTQRERAARSGVSEPWDPQIVQVQLGADFPENYMQLMIDRQFKAEVCQFVVSNVASRVDLENGRRLVIDWQEGSQLEFIAGAHGPEDGGSTRRPEFQCVGECDCKWVQHLEAGCDMAVDSIDSDYLPIAMLQLERLRREHDTDSEPVPRIAIHRQHSQKYEWVNCNRLLDGITNHITNHITDPLPDALAGREFELVAYLVALTKCDFVKGLPGIGPKTVWENLPELCPSLASAWREPGPSESGEFDVGSVADMVVLPLLRSRVSKLPDRSRSPSSRLLSLSESLEQAHAATGTQALTDNQSKDLQLPKLVCDIRNANWTVLYWTDCPAAPDPVDVRYGFRRLSDGTIDWDNNAAL
jgi:hypothetical protein